MQCLETQKELQRDGRFVLSEEKMRFEWKRMYGLGFDRKKKKDKLALGFEEDEKRFEEEKVVSVLRGERLEMNSCEMASRYFPQKGVWGLSDMTHAWERVND